MRLRIARLRRCIGCGCGCDEACIPLAVVRFGGGQGRAVDTGVRTVIRSIRELLDLIL